MCRKPSSVNAVLIPSSYRISPGFMTFRLLFFLGTKATPSSLLCRHSERGDRGPGGIYPESYCHERSGQHGEAHCGEANPIGLVGAAYRRFAPALASRNLIPFQEVAPRPSVEKTNNFNVVWRAPGRTGHFEVTIPSLRSRVFKNGLRDSLNATLA
jgi:hypothetical protein